MPSKETLAIFQHQPLYLKVIMTQQRIREWVDFYGKDGVYVSFSGGKDSTVLLHLVRGLYGIWKPNKEGLGMGYVFDQVNKIYGKDFIKYRNSIDKL